jgi:hypothetical protein
MLNAARWTVLGLLAASILVLAFAIGYVLADDGGDSSSGNVNASGDAKDLEGEDVDFDVLNQIIKLLDDRYVDQDRLDNRALYEAAINGMLQTLSDSGTFYVDPVTVATGHGPSGSFEGIGATVSTQDGQIVIVLPNTTGDEAATTGDKLVAAVATCAAMTATGEAVELGVSYGVASFPTDAKTAGALIEQADAKLYASKAARKVGRRGGRSSVA